MEVNNKLEKGKEAEWQTCKIYKYTNAKLVMHLPKVLCSARTRLSIAD